ncbi:MAG: nucleotidyltransferase family protein [Alphaproteobacteria bacterium]|nr:nucleotidyltransferase family protein [Alphaproteobacteria bacterium]
MTSPRAEVDLTLSLLRALSGGESRSPAAEGGLGNGSGFRAVSWHRLVAFASAHFVLQAIAAPLNRSASAVALPGDVQDFLAAFHEANVERNVRLLHALYDIANALNAKGVVPCALKGAAILLTADDASPASWRFMSDLDLLVPQEDLATCVETMYRLGFVTADDTYDPLTEAHFPPLISPCRTFSVELHTRLFGLDDFGLCEKSLMAGATLRTHRGAELLVPTLSHRIAHLLIHAQLHNCNHAIERIVLKDVLDLIMLQGRSSMPFDGSQVVSRFRDPAHREAVMALLEAWRKITGAPRVTPASPTAEAWAARAIARLYWPRWRTLVSVPGDVLRMESHRARTEMGHVRRRLKLLTDPARVRDVTSRWAVKQRQRLWG